MSSIRGMVPELWLEILNNIEPKDLMTLMSAYPEMKHLCADNLIWERFCRLHYMVQPRRTYGHCFDLYNRVLLPYAQLQGLWLDTSSVSGDVVGVSVSVDGDIVCYSYNKDGLGYTGTPREQFRLTLDPNIGTHSVPKLNCRHRCPKYTFDHVNLIDDLGGTHSSGKGISPSLVALTRLQETTTAATRNCDEVIATPTHPVTCANELVGIYAYDNTDTDAQSDEQASNGARRRVQRLVAINRSRDGKWLEAQQLIGYTEAPAGTKVFQVESTGEAIDTLAELFEDNSDIEVFSGHGYSVDTTCTSFSAQNNSRNGLVSSRSFARNEANAQPGPSTRDGNGLLPRTSSSPNENNGLVVIRDKTQNNRLLVWWLNTSDEPIVYNRVHLLRQQDPHKSGDRISSTEERGEILSGLANPPHSQIALTA